MLLSAIITERDMMRKTKAKNVPMHSIVRVGHGFLICIARERAGQAKFCAGTISDRGTCSPMSRPEDNLPIECIQRWCRDVAPAAPLHCLGYRP